MALDPPADSLKASPDERVGLVAVPQQEKAQVDSTPAVGDVEEFPNLSSGERHVQHQRLGWVLMVKSY